MWIAIFVLVAFGLMFAGSKLLDKLHKDTNHPDWPFEEKHKSGGKNE